MMESPELGDHKLAMMKHELVQRYSGATRVITALHKWNDDSGNPRSFCVGGYPS